MHLVYSGSKELHITAAYLVHQDNVEVLRSSLGQRVVYQSMRWPFRHQSLAKRLHQSRECLRRRFSGRVRSFRLDSRSSRCSSTRLSTQASNKHERPRVSDELERDRLHAGLYSPSVWARSFSIVILAMSPWRKDALIARYTQTSVHATHNRHSYALAFPSYQYYLNVSQTDMASCPIDGTRHRPGHCCSASEGSSAAGAVRQ